MAADELLRNLIQLLGGHPRAHLAAQQLHCRRENSASLGHELDLTRALELDHVVSGVLQAASAPSARPVTSCTDPTASIFANFVPCSRYQFIMGAFWRT